MANSNRERKDGVIGISSDEIDDLRRRLNGLLTEIADDRQLGSEKSAEEVLDRQQRIRRIQKARHLRGRHFRSTLFADPAWDMLLELYGNALVGSRVSVTSLCLASAVPATTALRWISALQKENLILKTDDPVDARRIFVTLSPQGVSAMEAYFAAVPFGGDPL